MAKSTPHGEPLMAIIFLIILALLFLVLAICLFLGHGAWLIAGYNTMSPEEQQKYDKKKVCRATSIVCGVCSILLLILAYLGYRVEYCGMDESLMLPYAIGFVVVLLICVAAAMIYTNTKAKK